MKLLFTKSSYAPFYFVIALMICGVFSGCQEATTETTNDSDTFSTYFEHYPDVITQRGGGKDANLRLSEAMKHYSAKDFESAAPIFDELISDKASNAAVYFYGGLTYLSVDKPEQAVKQFEHLVTQKDATFGVHAKWYLGLAYLKSKNADKAEPLFQELERGTSSYQKKAARLISSMPKIKAKFAKELKSKNVATAKYYEIGANPSSYDYTELGNQEEISIRTTQDSEELMVRFNQLRHNNSVIRLYNKSGQLVHMEKLSSISQGKETKIKIGHLDRGQYMLKVEIDEAKEIKQRIKLK